MRKAYVLLVGSALAGSAPASAAEELQFGKAPAWVVPQAVPTTAASSADAPVAFLLMDQQIQLRPGKMFVHSELAMKIQKPDGLSAGNISIPWNPATDTVTINKLTILRGNQTIDVLAGGQKFTTMRREAGLEAAMLDGYLTANIQPEGLQEGDIVDLATTIEHADPVMGNHVETNFAAWPGVPIKRAHVLLQWPSSLKLNVRAKGISIRPVSRGDSTVVELTSEDVQPLLTPKNAPPRFSIGRLGEATDFGSWSDVAAMMKPLFRTAEAIPPTGPLRAEVEKIRTSVSDPKLRAEKALQLVQDRVRYVALLMGQGGYVPANAETTWSRRFGDCKAKTALLLGILHALGIDADPILVQSKAGDAIADRLPLISYFDHVLVRAHIGGKDYYLDGTRTGDTAIDQIEVPDFGWGLPVVDNAQLVHLVSAPLDRPQLETVVTIDASAGIYTPAGVTAAQIIRGDLAVALNAGLTGLTTAQRKEYFDNYWKKLIDDVTPGDSAFVFEKEARQVRLSMQGKLTLDWSGGFFHLPMSSIGYDPDLDRAAGPFHDAPFAIDHPLYAQTETKLRLPPAFLPATVGKMLPEPVHATLLGVEYSRIQSATTDGMKVQTTSRSLVSEVSYKDALAASDRLKALANGDVSVRLPASYRPTAADLSVLKTDKTGSADDLVTRGNTLMNNGQLDEAVADFNKALELDSNNVTARADRAIAYSWMRKPDLAKQDIDAALSIDPTNAVALRARGLVAEIANDCAQAVKSYTDSLLSEPNNGFAIGHRAMCEQELGRYAEALTDIQAALKQSPQWPEMRLLKIEALVRLGQKEQADRETDQFAKDNPGLEAATWIQVAQAFSRAGMQDRSMDAFDRALAIKAEPSTYVSRAQMRPASDYEGRLADLNAALKLEPLDSGALAAKAKLLADHGDRQAALAIYDRGIRAMPGQSPLSLGRAFLLYKMGRKAEAERSITAWRKGALTGTELNNLCWEKATAGIMLDSAVTDCRDALKMNPGSGAYLDSLGLALLKLGRLDEAIAAYDKAIAANTGADSLMGRAIVYARKGDRTHAEADAAKARKLDAQIDSVFEEYGLKLF